MMKRFAARIILFILPMAMLATNVQAGIRIFPVGRIELLGRDAVQQLIAEKMDGERMVGDVTEHVHWESSDPGIVRIENGLLRAVSDGAATLTARSDLGTAIAEVVVANTQQATQWEFARHVLPVLSRAGCNTGACHGALAGKGGFRLSLRGYHPAGDYHSITRSARGRRIELSDPGRSLIVAKPSGMIRHKGGLAPQTRIPRLSCARRMDHRRCGGPCGG